MRTKWLNRMLCPPSLLVAPADRFSNVWDHIDKVEAQTADNASGASQDSYLRVGACEASEAAFTRNLAYAVHASDLRAR